MKTKVYRSDEDIDFTLKKVLSDIIAATNDKIQDCYVTDIVKKAKTYRGFRWEDRKNIYL